MTGRRFRRFLAPRPQALALVLALLVGLTFTLTSLNQRIAQAPTPKPVALQQTINRFERLPDFQTAAAGAGLSRRRPQPLRINIEISNVYNVVLPMQTFMANGTFQLEWPEAIQTWMEQEEIEAAQLIHFTNNIVSYDLLIEPNSPKPRLLTDGWREQTFAFSGHFWIEDIDFLQFPFLDLQLPVRIEINPEAFSLSGPRPIALLADPLQPGLLGSLIELPGLVLRGGRIDPFVHRLAPDGLVTDGTSITRPSSRSFSQVLISAFFDTPPTASIGQWLLPILIVMLTVFVAPSVSGRLSEIRIAVPSAALLTLVVMQQSFEVTIPPLSYLTFLDLIYLWCYAVTVSLFILFVWSSNQLASLNRDDPAYSMTTSVLTARITRIDRSFQIGTLLATTLFVLLAWQR
jgi:hypothetical protein